MQKRPKPRMLRLTDGLWSEEREIEIVRGRVREKERGEAGRRGWTGRRKERKEREEEKGGEKEIEKEQCIA